LVQRLKNISYAKHVILNRGASVGSIALESSVLDFLNKNSIAVVDLECSAFYSAANAIGRKSLALLYITDIIGDRTPFDPLSHKEEGKIRAAQKQITKILMELTRNL